MFTPNAMLETLIQKIANDNPNGLRHADFVRKVRDMGYCHRTSEPISISIHEVIRQFVEEGVLVRCEDENRGVREYSPAAMAGCN